VGFFYGKGEKDMGKRRRIYPEEGRIGFYISDYGEIAMAHYCEAKRCIEAFRAADFRELALPEHAASRFYRSVMISIVFSAMAIEAFVNDYGAACTSDDFFYDNFERLSTLGKLQLIAKLLLHTEIDKSTALYSHLKVIFGARDKLVHSKTRSAREYFEKRGYEYGSESERDVWEGFDPAKEPILDKEEIANDFEICRVGIKAMRELAYFFDRLDESAIAVVKLFGVDLIGASSEAGREVAKEFSVKMIEPFRS